MSDERPVVLMTTQEVADLVRRRPRTVLDWVRRKKLEPAGTLPDGAYLFDRADVMHFVRFGAKVKHATVDPGTIRAFVDAAHRQAMTTTRRHA